MIIETTLSGRNRRSFKRLKHRLQMRNSSSPEISGFLDIVKGVFRGVKGGVQAGQASKTATRSTVAKKAPVKKKLPAKKNISSKMPIYIGIGGVAIFAGYLAMKKKKR